MILGNEHDLIPYYFIKAKEILGKVYNNRLFLLVIFKIEKKLSRSYNKTQSDLSRLRQQSKIKGGSQ